MAAIDPARPLAGRVALVTGSTRGIGKGIAGRLLELGAAVGVNGIDNLADAICAEFRAAGLSAVTPVDGDVADEATVDRMFTGVEAAFGRPVDILVNNAGIPTTGYHLLDCPTEVWDRIIATNLRGIFLCSRRAARAMVAAKTPGAIVNIGSVHGDRSMWHDVPYDASKGGVEAMTRAMAIDLGRHNIRVNSVCPGFTRTERWDSLSASEVTARRSNIPLQMEATPLDIANAVAFLVGPYSANIAGVSLYVDGGLTASLFTRPYTEPSS